MLFSIFHRFRGVKSLAKMSISVRMDEEIIRWIDKMVVQSILKQNPCLRVCPEAAYEKRGRSKMLV